MQFPNLYKQKDTNKWMVWNIQVVVGEDDTNKKMVRIVRNHGLEHGVWTESVKRVSCGKNIGKKNETTAYGQACLEATSMWNKQKTTHSYTEQKKESEPPNYKPMLAHSFDKHANKIVFPCFAQPKLDGVRLLCTVDGNNKVTCLSRTCKPFSQVPLQNITDSIKNLGLRNVTLDGELFTPDLVFEDIVGICRNRLKPDQTKYDKLEYHVYDIVTKEPMDYTDRLAMLKMLVPKNVPYITLVDTCTLQSAHEVYDKHDYYASLNFEGIMLRNMKGTYASARSYNLQKYKHFQDQEFRITDVKEAGGNDTGTAILQCEMGTDNKEARFFWVRSKGSREYRTQLLLSKDVLIGKQLTVRYQNLTDHGLPRFPVGIAIRDYE